MCHLPLHRASPLANTLRTTILSLHVCSRASSPPPKSHVSASLVRTSVPTSNDLNSSSFSLSDNAQTRKSCLPPLIWHFRALARRFGTPLSFLSESQTLKHAQHGVFTSGEIVIRPHADGKGLGKREERGRETEKEDDHVVHWEMVSSCYVLHWQ